MTTVLILSFSNAQALFKRRERICQRESHFLKHFELASQHRGVRVLQILHRI